MFEVVGHTPWVDLEPMLREVPLKDEPDTRPYANATISLEQFRLSELASTTRYLLEGLVVVQGLIRASLVPQGCDQLDLREGGLILDSGQGPKRIIPPIVETYEPEGPAKYVIDGAHRVRLAQQIAEQEGVEDPEITVIYVRGGITDPPYATPNEWHEVRVAPERPADKSKWKNYRDFPNRYALYRNYNAIVESVPRGLDP